MLGRADAGNAQILWKIENINCFISKEKKNIKCVSLSVFCLKKNLESWKKSNLIWNLSNSNSTINLNIQFNFERIEIWCHAQNQISLKISYFRTIQNENNEKRTNELLKLMMIHSISLFCQLFFIFENFYSVWLFFILIIPTHSFLSFFFIVIHSSQVLKTL